ncbi:MAG: HD domain-containing protein [Clostridia bacterium]
MDGLFIIGSNYDAGLCSGDDECMLSMLLKRKNIEIMRQTITSTATIWISPADDKSTLEFFMVISGELTVHLSPTESHVLKAGDSFFVEGLKESVHIIANTDTSILYITNQPLFDCMRSFHDRFEKLMIRIDEKDHITFKHSKNVLNYCAALYGVLNPCDLTMDDLCTAAFFHDIGKCSIPDELLKKQGRLTCDEYNIMKEHSEHSYNMLLPIYGATIAGIARSHHERLDGSGYPDGLCATQICLGSRIIAVADAFDAMTTVRSYNHIKSRHEAIAELRSLSHQYDLSIVDAMDAYLQSISI